jgi:hypothetical protein
MDDKIEIAWLSDEGYYELHVMDEKDEATFFITADTDDELITAIREALPRIRIAPSQSAKETQ